ncbi:MAG: arginine--tRNA ligase [Bacilli bacterium]|jgi:arginyl-tRNA synthetase|nr:arginine--tRNA ligase [Bacilli bacterium]
MSIETKLKEKISVALKELGHEVALDSIIIEHSKEVAHGDFASNVALQNARVLKANPRKIAEDIAKIINMDGIDHIEIAGPGFLNFFLKEETLTSILAKIKTDGSNFGSSSNGNHKRINVEFVSANPTGDLHLGHARGAAIGDVICRLYTDTGFDVVREYYVNDAGIQINHLGESLRARYHQEFNDNVAVPEDGYHGEDLVELAKIIKNEVNDKYMVDSAESSRFFMRRGVELELAKIENDLKLFRVYFDKYSFETDVRNDNGVEKIIEALTNKQFLYEDDGALFLKTTVFGDDKDRVVVKKNGQYTYFLPDIAYHLNKLSRDFSKLIDVLGADHHGYISRMKAALQMFGYPEDILDVELIQMVRLIKDGQEFKMSKRSGKAVTLRELCDEVGVDAVRYYFVNRAASSHLDFDLDLAHETSSANPVYYAQYAHARLATVLGKAKKFAFDYSGVGLSAASEVTLLKLLADFPNIEWEAAISRSPYKMTNYIQKLASAIHGFYTECRVIDEENLPLTASRLALVDCSEIVLRKALNLIGVSAPEKM